MCGIAGYSIPPGSIPFPGWTETAKAALSHRGPDNGDVFMDKVCGTALVHTRLAILDLTPLGHQPMLSEDGRVAITFNGEIYNFRELRCLLAQKGHSFKGESDTEVLLNLYLSYRPFGHQVIDAFSAILKRLNGIFALAVWDSDLNSLLLARDAFGVKPLYYQYDSKGLYFASEIKALPQVPLKLDPPVLDRYLSFLWSPGEGTPASIIKKLGPGQAMWVVQGRVQQYFNWYHLPVARLSPPALSISTQSQAVNGVANHLRKAVQRQLISDVPVGAFLSGGLDSSSVVAFARECIPNIRCFTIDVSRVGDEGFPNDLLYAKRVSRYLGVPLEVVQVDPGLMAAGLEEMVWQLDEPLADPAPLNLLFMSRLARKHGIKVMLSGAGGDDLFTGYRRHLALGNERYWSWMPRHLRIQLRQFAIQFPPFHPLFRRFRKAFSGAHLEGDARLVHYFRWIERPDLRALYTPAFLAALGPSEAEDPMFAFLESLPKNTPPLERMLALEQRFFLTDHNLTYTDKMSMAVGVEVRVPFLDLDLVDFAARIPTRYKQRGREGKWVLKKAMEPYLPHDVIYRTKSGFGAPLRRWLRVELRDWLFDTLSPQRIQLRGLFDPQAVHRLIAANAEGKIDASYTLLSLACIEIWCQHFIDRSVFNFSD